VYIRFVIGEIHPDSLTETGVFHVAYRLRDESALYEYEEGFLRELLKWFSENLETPSKFTNSKPPYHSKKTKAISWFKDSAVEHIAKLRDIIAILQNHGIAVRMITTDRPGYVAYEDEHQIVAESFSDCRP
jgi:hypothetical protein